MTNYLRRGKIRDKYAILIIFQVLESKQYNKDPDSTNLKQPIFVKGAEGTKMDVFAKTHLFNDGITIEIYSNIPKICSMITSKQFDFTHRSILTFYFLACW